jgi:hypothetical protein
MFKIQGVYQAPHGFQFGLNFTHQSGRPWSRQVRVSDLVGVSTTILAEPISGDRRVPDWNIVDLSLEKALNLNERTSVNLFAYGLNLTNSGINEDVLDRRGTSESFGLPTGFFPPRRLMVGAHLRF